ncbi:hypothetical protein BGZ73_001125 [Actinomortierella ambigua]|nr:hypothetical protein BGZ73_001125 [Actinomortierella ambigua]
MAGSSPSPDTHHRHTFDADYYRTIESNTAASSSTWPSPPPSPPPMHSSGGPQSAEHSSNNHNAHHHYHHYHHSPSSSSGSGSDDDLDADAAQSGHPVTVVFEEPNWVERHLRKTKAYAIAQRAFDQQEAMEAAEAAESEAIGRLREQQP